MIRGKIYNKSNKRVYRLLNIDYFNNKIDVVDGDSYTTFEFKDIRFLESTGIRGIKDIFIEMISLLQKKTRK